MSLRRAQFKVAMSGNVAMLKHLGINWLEQSPNPQPTAEIGSSVADEQVDVDISALTLQELEVLANIRLVPKQPG